MRLMYCVVYIALIAALLVCTILARRSDKPVKDSVGLLEAALIVPIFGNLLVIASTARTLAIVGSYIYFLGMDLLLFALVNFTNAYCQGIGTDAEDLPGAVYDHTYGADHHWLHAGILLFHRHTR